MISAALDGLLVGRGGCGVRAAASFGLEDWAEGAGAGRLKTELRTDRLGFAGFDRFLETVLHALVLTDAPKETDEAGREADLVDVEPNLREGVARAIMSFRLGRSSSESASQQV